MTKDEAKEPEIKDEALPEESAPVVEVVDTTPLDDPATSEEPIEEAVAEETLPKKDDKKPAKKVKKSKKDQIKDALKAKDDRIKELESQVEGQQKEVDEHKDNFLKKRAEFENFRRRMEKDKEQFSKFALEKIMTELLPIVDSFEMSMKSHQGEEQYKEIYDGFTLIYKQLMGAIEKQGLATIEALDQPFDPNFHQAVSNEATEGVESGIVVKEYQKGFMYHDRVLRPSMVVVSE
jgi:molecular chaperone GrpE